MSGRRAVFLDRDGVLIEDVDLLVGPERVRVLDGVPAALDALAEAGFRLVVVTNQTVVARGLASERDVDDLHEEMRELLPQLDAVYVCPHHPNATLAAFRADCECRKPRPGLLVRAARDLGLDLRASTIVGDRISDVAAGAAAGCATVLVRSGAHAAPAIETSVDLRHVVPDHECDDLAAAAGWILGRSA